VGSKVSYQAYGETAVVSADGRTIVVGPYTPVSCGAYFTAVARETATMVALFLRAVNKPEPSGCSNGISAAPVWAQNIRLARPLGNRKLVNGATGGEVAWISAKFVLRPAALPAGYRLILFVPAVHWPGAGSSGPAGAYQLYGSPHSQGMMVIDQSAGSVQVPGPGPGGWIPIRVRGLQGRATRNLITWRETGLTDFIVVGGQQGTEEPQMMSTQQLIAVAESSPAQNVGSLPVPGK
jgi:hypothetical protein